MKVSQSWLQKFFNETLPSESVIDNAFTFHAFEIEERNGDLIELNVLPNRAADCLSHRGVAKELGAILGTAISNDPLKSSIPEFPTKESLVIKIEDENKCKRYIGALVRGIKVKQSPVWLKETLESVGQRSINNVVDATNYVMLNIGQPLHVFDASKLKKTNSSYSINIRNAKDGENITTLSGDEYTLQKEVLVISDGNSDNALGIAGIKGGVVAEVDEHTVDIIVESASFDGPTVRHATQYLKLITDASLRFQNRPSPELAVYGMRDVLKLIIDIAGGEIESVVDLYPKPSKTKQVSVSLSRVNSVLGSEFTKEEVLNVFSMLGLDTEVSGDVFTVTPPFERTDLNLPEDLIEEVISILGYDRIIPKQLSSISNSQDSGRYRSIEKIKDFLVEKGFIEISTQSFAKKGDITLSNPFDKTKPSLRTSLSKNMEKAFSNAKQYAQRTLEPGVNVMLFEIGNVFTKNGEEMVVETSEPVQDIPDISDSSDYVPKQYKLSKYKPFSIYPFMLRDIAVWTPEGTESEDIKSVIINNVGELLVRVDEFDSFEKDGRVSYAFRIVFESKDRTLTDGEINLIIDRLTDVLNKKDGYNVR